MTNTYLEHPAEDVLERYLMHHSDEQEIELVETHTLACEPCIQRLEALEIQIAATKLALREMHNEQVAKAFSQPAKGSWRQWLKAPRLSLAGGVLAVALIAGITLPNMHRASDEQVSLYDYRGQESPMVTKGHPLDVNLNAVGLNQAQFDIQLVSETGSQVWSGSASSQDGKLEVKIPALTAPGAYYFRVYATGSHDELREFAFNVR
jgi:hypothetical protein